MMKSERKDGGPAFPRQATLGTNNHIGGSGVWTSADPGHTGMSLRDYFAAQALVGMTASPALMEVVTSGSILDGTTFERLAKRAYQMSDALLKARSEREE